MVAVRGSAALRGRWISVDTTSTGFGYNKVRGLNALIATVTTPGLGASDRGAATPQRSLRLTPWRETFGR